MNKDLGLSLKYYVDHYADMEALYVHGTRTPEGVQKSDWRVLREVMLKATFQARALLATSTTAIADALKKHGAAVFPQDQKSTLDDNWVHRLGLGASLTTGPLLLVGSAIDVPRDGEARLQHWLECSPRSIAHEFSEWLRQHGLGTARIADRKQWRGTYLLVSELDLGDDLSAAKVTAWCENRATVVFGNGWGELHRLGARM